MKNLCKVTLISLLLAVTVFGCKKETSGPTTPTISISSDKSVIAADGKDGCTLTVKDNTGKEVTSQCQFTVNGAPLSSNTFTATTTGKYKIKAQYNNVESSAIEIDAREKYTITIDKTQMIADGIDRVVVTIMDYKNSNKSAEGKFTVNGSSITSNSFSTTSVGNYEIKAQIENFNFATTIEAKSNIAFIGRVLIEEFTGTWCGYCPRVAYKIDDAKAVNKNVLAMAIHNGDALTTNYELTLSKRFKISGLPTAILNRCANWDENYNSLLQYVKTDVPVGIAIESSVDGSSSNAKVILKFKDASMTNLKIAAYITEDNVIESQANYYNDGKGNPIVKFKHMNVLREKMSKELLGDIVPSTSIVPGGTYEIKLTAILKNGWNVANCKALVLVTNGNNDEVINSQEVYLGQSIGY